MIVFVGWREWSVYDGLLGDYVLRCYELMLLCSGSVRLGIIVKDKKQRLLGQVISERLVYRVIKCCAKIENQ